MMDSFCSRKAILPLSPLNRPNSSQLSSSVEVIDQGVAAQGWGTGYLLLAPLPLSSGLRVGLMIEAETLRLSHAFLTQLTFALVLPSYHMPARPEFTTPFPFMINSGFFLYNAKVKLTKRKRCIPPTLLQAVVTNQLSPSSYALPQQQQLRSIYWILISDHHHITLTHGCRRVARGNKHRQRRAKRGGASMDQNVVCTSRLPVATDGTNGAAGAAQQQELGTSQQQQRPMPTALAAPSTAHFQSSPANPYTFPYSATDYGYSSMFLGAQHQNIGRAAYVQEQQSTLDYMVALNPVHSLQQASSQHGNNGTSGSVHTLFIQHQQQQQGTSASSEANGGDGGTLLRVLPPFQSPREGVEAKMDSEGMTDSDSESPSVNGGGRGRGVKRHSSRRRGPGGGGAGAEGVIRKGSRQSRHLLGIVPPNNSMPTPIGVNHMPSSLNDSGLASGIPSPGIVPPGTINPMETFCTVPGRLSLLSSTPKYRVTVGEIHRRINPPECLNASVLGGILRRAKSKDGGKSLRDQLKTYGLVLPAGRRKTANVSTLTALVEYEAFNLARDFHALCENEFPAKQIADYLTFKNCTDSPLGIQQRKGLLGATRTMLGELADLLKSDRSPVCQGNARPVLEHSIQQHLTHFSMVTHGFGTPAVLASIVAIINWLNESEKDLQQMLHQQQHTQQQQQQQGNKQ
uniref:Transcription factor AP-2 C-terminal domain-containing protein n=1 Tax=Globodera rostochiensis TaxID=31243 RepID=A0A914HH39_GLORO